jgi:flavodoxin I
MPENSSCSSASTCSRESCEGCPSKAKGGSGIAKEPMNKASNVKNRRIFLFGTAGFGGSDAYFQKILGQVRQSIDPSNTIIGEYMCQGKMPQSVRERYMKMKENPEHPANLDALIKNFDCALSHPDSDDLEKLRNLCRLR